MANHALGWLVRESSFNTSKPLAYQPQNSATQTRAVACAHAATLPPPAHHSYPSLYRYDIFQEGNLYAWQGMQHNAAPASRGLAKLVIDPCGHCQAAASLFPHDTLFGRVLLPILMSFDMMSNDNPANQTWPPVPEDVKNITFYVMGDDENGAQGNYWTTMNEFPVPAPTSYFLNAGGALLPTAPAAGAAALTFVSDPSDPVRTIGGNNLEIPCGPLDQRPNEDLKRQDILIFTSPPLDAPLAVVGTVTAALYFSADVADLDLVVKLVDVYPSSDPGNPLLAGESILVADGIARARWRGFPSQGNGVQLLSGNAGDVYSLNISLWATAYVFGAGHSVRVHVQPSNYPRFFPNDQLGTPMSAMKPGGPNATAHVTVHANASLPSAISLPVVPMSALPPFDVTAAEDAMIARMEPTWAANVRSRASSTESMRDWLTRRVAKALGATTAHLRVGLD